MVDVPDKYTVGQFNAAHTFPVAAPKYFIRHAWGQSFSRLVRDIPEYLKRWHQHRTDIGNWLETSVLGKQYIWLDIFAVCSD
jgi:hypothetical protein